MIECHEEFIRKYHIIRRSEIFSRDNCGNTRRLNDIKFKEDIMRLCKEYEVNYNKIYTITNGYLPEFNGIDRNWNPYA